MRCFEVAVSVFQVKMALMLMKSVRNSPVTLSWVGHNGKVTFKLSSASQGELSLSYIKLYEDRAVQATVMCVISRWKVLC